MAFDIIGRDEELASVGAFVDAVRGDPAALVLEGEVGIGKSTVWLAGVEHARMQGLHVLSSRPAAASAFAIWTPSGKYVLTYTRSGVDASTFATMPA